MDTAPFAMGTVPIWYYKHFIQTFHAILYHNLYIWVKNYFVHFNSIVVVTIVKQ